MTETETKLQKIAGEYLDGFKVLKRDKKDDDDTTYTLTEKARGTEIQDMAFKAHGDMLPDDYRYNYIVEALEALRDYDDPDNASDEIEADVYNYDLTKWLNSRNDRSGYIDEAVVEFGHASDAMGDIMNGQVQEKREVFGIVRAWLEERAEDED